MKRRVISAAIMLTFVALGFWFQSLEWMLVIGAAIIAVICTQELCDMMRKKELRVYRRVATWGVLALVAEAILTQMQNAISVFGIAMCWAWLVRMPSKAQGAWGDISATVFSMAYVGIPMAAMVHIFLSGDGAQAWLLLALSIIWCTDSFALFVGRAFGTIKLSPQLSPGKTVEGSLGGILGALLAVGVARTLCAERFDSVSDVHLILFAIGFSIISQIGDLAESMLKRDVGVKDSGSELTGHGGFLDLMDAMLFCAVPLVVYLQVFHPELLNT